MQLQKEREKEAFVTLYKNLILNWPSYKKYTLQIINISKQIIPGTDGGANRVSLMAKRKRSKASQVSRSIRVDSWATASIVLKTLWQYNACLLMISAPRNKS